MAKNTTFARKQRGALGPEEARKLFSTVDETGHTDEERAKSQRQHRKAKGVSVDIDPLTGEDPSGSKVEHVIARTTVGFVVVLLAIVVVSQIALGLIRRATTADLSQHADIRSVASALKGGVEWGNGFTQFPDDFSVQEADENTGRIEVSVIDIRSHNALEVFAGSQVQATAFAVNALLNPKIDTVIYHVNVHLNDAHEIEHSSFFGFLKPSGNVTSFMTFVWTKTQSKHGVNFSCTITGINEQIQDQISDRVVTSLTPVSIFGSKSSAL